MAKHKTMSDIRTAKLIAARQRASHGKRVHTLHTLDRLVQSGARISFAAVAREADVSTWLVYNNPELKQAITNAMKQPARQAVPRSRSTGSSTSQASLRTDLELARDEITALRRSERKLRERLQRRLGAEIEQIGRSELHARINDLETVVAKLRRENNDLVETNTRLTQLADQQHDNLDTANTLLRRYMKEASRAQAEPI
jgi:chromosome segregation ATPase